SEDEQAIRDALDKMLNQEKEATEQSNAVRKEFEAKCDRDLLHRKAPRASSINSFNTISTPVNVANAFRGVNAASASGNFSAAGPSFVPLGVSFPIDITNLPDYPLMPDLEDTVEVQSTGIFGNAYDDDDLVNYNTPYAYHVVGADVDFNNMEPSTIVSPIPTTRIHSIHPKDQIIRDPKSAVQTKGMTKKSSREQAMISYILKQQRTNHKDLPEPFNDTYEPPRHTKKVFSNMARQSKSFSGKITPLFESMLVQNQAPEGKRSVTPPEPQPTPSTSQPNVLEPQTEPLQTETPPTISHEPQTEANIEQILPSPSTYQRKHRKTQKHMRAKKVTKLPQTCVPLDLRADEAVHKEGVTAPRHHGGAPAQTRSERVLEKPSEPPLSEGHTPRSGEDMMEHQFELMANVLDLKKKKDAQAVEILRLKKRVKGLERQRKSSTSQPRRRKYIQVESSDDDLNEEDASKQEKSNDKTEQ
ncbi:hypothetical protein Tco_0987542, partial [Tanacetum coccineum]